MAKKVSKDTKKLVKLLKKEGVVEDKNSEAVMEAILEEVPEKDKLLEFYSKK